MSANQYNEGCLAGNCDFCGQKTDCIFLSILKKVTRLENIIEKLTSQAVQTRLVSE
jgi:hypothetical protein